MFSNYSSFLVLVTLVGATSAALWCKDESGKNVDWFVAIKIPKQPKATGEPFTTGFSYAYITSADAKGSASWKLGKNLVNDSRSIYGRTLEPLYKNSDKYSYIMYNDQPPEHAGAEKGHLAHAKGVVGMDSAGGFWLIHSIPKFPNPPSDKKYGYPDTGSNFGQSSLCISFRTAKEASDILTQISFNRPNIYTIRNAANIKNLDKAFYDLEMRNWVDESDENINFIDSQQGTQFQSFARNSKAAGLGELYSTMVAPKLSSALIVETWRKGAGGVLPSNCSKNGLDVMNVSQMELKLTGVKKGEPDHTGVWPYTRDHSKWAISAESKKPFVCIGDINRMESQSKRGGGTVCMKSPTIWNAFRDAVSALEACNKKG